MTIVKKPGVGGWVKVRDSALIQAIDAAGIESDKMKFTYERWVPRWVPQAAQVYRNHLAASGEDTYAGMTLSEFIRMTKPE